MAFTSFPFSLSVFFFLLMVSGNQLYLVESTHPSCGPTDPLHAIPIHPEDVDRIQFALNLEFLEAEFFLNAALGYGLDKIAPKLALGGPPPIGAKIANLDPLTRRIVTEFGYQEVDHLRAIESTVGGYQRPLIDLSSTHFAKIFDDAFGNQLQPPFDPYANSINYMLGSYVIPYMGLVGYVGTNPFLIGYRTKRLLAGLLGVESGQDAVIRTYLYQQAEEIVHPYNHTVAEFTARISELRNRLAKCGIKDEGIIVPRYLGAENLTSSNVLSADAYSLSYSRTPAEILRVVYGSGDEHVPGGFYPKGGNGRVARSYLRN